MKVSISNFSTILLLMILVGCQDDAPKVNFQPEFDEDMVNATALVERYLSSSNERIGMETTITVLRFDGEKLLYATDKDIVDSYQELTEETVTAEVEEGELVFWYSGSGLSDLEGIEFDQESQTQLDYNPESIFYDKLWLTSVSEEKHDDDFIYLKYDIIYKAVGSDEYIRLDPKIKVSQ